MNYDDALGWLYSTQRVGIKLGLENIRRLLDELGVQRALEEQRPRILHVAGTNGKGSVCAMMDAISRATGGRTGLFTSPHLVSFRERIRLNGEDIPEGAAAVGLTRIRELVADWESPPTFFEIATVLGFSWFLLERAGTIVLETGLGGRLDSTNALTPSASVITPIGLDHWQYLGNTLGEIAREKAGIFKPGVPAVSALQLPEAARVLRETAQAVGAPLEWISKPAPWETALAGSHQRFNAALAVAGLRAAGMPISDEAIARGLREVVWPGRFQRITGPAGVDLVLDGAHNAPAAARLVLTWREVFGSENPVLMLGILRDKDGPAICREFAPLAETVVVTPVQSPRSCSAEELANTVREAMRGPGQEPRCLIAASVETALALAQKEGRRLGKRVLVTGSLFLVGEVLALLGGNNAEKSAQ